MGYKINFITITLLLFSSSAFSQLSETALYARCFSRLTNSPVPLKDPIYEQVKNRQIAAVDACLNLLKQADLNNNGTFVSKGKFSKKILNTFYNFHRTWFPTSTVEQISGYRNEFDSNTVHIVELSSPSLSITHSLFSKSPIKNVLSGSEDYYALRGDENQNVATEPIRSVSGINTSGQELQRDTPAPALFEGDLFGIKKKALNFVLDNYSVGALTGNVLSSNSTLDLNLPVNQFTHFGGGILGQQSFFLLNSGHPKGTIFDGSAKLPRKWAKTAMESLLCVSLPVLRENDVLSMVDPNSSVTFRNHASCMTCHATMDQFAATARNLVVAETQPDLNNSITKSIFVSSFKTNKESTGIYSSSPIAGYKNQKPKGKLFYRSYSNSSLVDISVDNMEQIGQKLAETEEYYQCLSKRYFEYFTGINVALYDTKDRKNSELNLGLTDRDKEDRKFVEYLAQELRSSQSLSRVIELIFKSNYYSSPTYRMEGAQ